MSRRFPMSSTPTRGAAVPQAVLRASAEVSEHRLENGMRVIVAERHSDPVVAVLLFYRVGSRNESEREAGVSHFLEHMMFKGTGRHGKGEVDRLTTELGGQNNAFTGNDHTAYWFEFASDRWETALDIEADRMAKLLLDPVEFDAERQVVLEELAMGEDDPWRVLSRRVEAALFPRHPYGRPIIGYRDTLLAMSVGDMGDYYERFYHPGNATLIICGDVKAGAALRAVRKRFGAMGSGRPYEEADGFRPPLEEPGGEVRLEMGWDDSARRLCMAWSTVPAGTEDDYVLDLIQAVLASGRMSRLQRRLVLDGELAVSISASNDTRVEGGAFWLFIDCRQDVEAAAIEAVIDEELARLATEPVTAAELARARALMESSEAYDAESVTDVAEEIGQWAVDVHWSHAFNSGEKYKGIKPKMLRDVAARYLGPERRVLGWCVPEEERASVRSARPQHPKKKQPLKKAQAKKAQQNQAARSGKRRAARTAATKKRGKSA